MTLYIKDRVIVRTLTNASPTFIWQICVNIITAVQTECNRGRVDSAKRRLGAALCSVALEIRTPNRKTLLGHLMSWCLLFNPVVHGKSKLRKYMWTLGVHLFRAFLESEISLSLLSVYSLGLKPAAEDEMRSATNKGHFSPLINKDEIKKVIDTKDTHTGAGWVGGIII